MRLSDWLSPGCPLLLLGDHLESGIILGRVHIFNSTILGHTLRKEKFSCLHREGFNGDLFIIIVIEVSNTSTVLCFYLLITYIQSLRRLTTADFLGIATFTVLDFCFPALLPLCAFIFSTKSLTRSSLSTVEKLIDTLFIT